MKFFPSKNSTPPVQPGRRRPRTEDAGAKQAQAFSYYSRRSGTPGNTARSVPEATPDEASQRPFSSITGMNKLVMLLSALVLLAGTVYSLNLGSQPKIVTRTTNGGTYFMQQPQVYQETAAHALQSSLLNRNKLTADTSKVSQEITSHYPEVAKADVDLPLIGSQPVVYVTPHRPTIILTTNDSSAYLLDENGRALVSTSQISNPDELAVPTIQDKSGIKVALGTQALPTGIVSFTESLMVILKAAGIEYGNLSLPPASSELDVAIKNKPYFVKFNLQGEVRQQAGTFIATKQRLEKDRVTPGEYIDVRVPERAYYK